MPNTAESAWKEQHAKLTTVLKAQQKKSVWSGKAKAKDGSVAAAIKREAKAQGFNVKKQAVFGTVWEIQKHGNGIPNYRVKRVEVLVKAANESFCRRLAISVTGSYKGGGRYEKPVANPNHFKVFRIGSCK